MKRFVIVLAVLGVLGSTAHGFAEELPTMTVWKSPWCGCCGNWVEHVRAAGFEVEVKEVEDLGVVKRMAGVPDDLESCHTARVGGYTVEGHVPVSDIIRLLDEQPNAHGLVVPGMPSGSPGMENGEQDPYDVLLIKRDGETEVFRSHR
jgi:hypothetical protein